MLTGGMLTLARADRQKLMTETASVYRRTSSPDGIGGVTTLEALVTAAAACYVGQPQGAREREVAERLDLAQPVTVTFPYGTDVRNGDRVAVGGRSLVVLQALSTGSFAVDARFMCSERL